MIAHLAGRARDDAALRWLIEGTTKLSMMLFVPASLVVLIAGILLAIDGPWSFGELWTVLGLIGYAATLEREGMTPAAKGEIHHMLVLSRLDYVTLTLVIAVMALKPTGDDVAVLTVMAIVLVAGAGVVFTRASRRVAAPAR